MNESLFLQDIFTPGPVRMYNNTLSLGAEQTPYFRNESFSEVLLQCEQYLLSLANAPSGSRVIFITASGTAAMESVVLNLLSAEKPVAVINGGSFGQRFVDICSLHGVEVKEVLVDRDPLTDGKKINSIDGVEALLINHHETSVGHLYDLNATGSYCDLNDCLHIVDAISSFVSDPIDMQSQLIDALIISSHKGLALPPGLSMVLLSPKALERIVKPRSYYFNFETHLKNGLRGQTPFTPAVHIVLQLHERLRSLSEFGIKAEWDRVYQVASCFRERIARLPLSFYSSHMPNSMTALKVGDGFNAYDIVQELESRFNCIVAPNGGDLKDSVFRVSHQGAANINDMMRLVDYISVLFKECEG